MNGDERARRMRGYLPLLLQSGPRIGDLFQALGAELGVMERGLVRLMRSRWYTLAEGYPSEADLVRRSESEIGRIGALFGLHPGRGEDADYFRRHLAALVDVHRTGINTAPALLRLVSLVYMAKQPPEIGWSGEVAVGRFQIPVEGGSWQEVRVEIADNPGRDASASFEGLGAGQDIVVSNGGLAAAIPEISLRAEDADVAAPMFAQPGTGFELIFVGIVPRGSTLLLRHERAPAIDGRSADAPLLLGNPTRFFDESNPTLTSNARSRFDAPGACFSSYEWGRSLPTLPPGESQFRYDTLPRAELRSYLASASSPLGIDVDVFPEQKSTSAVEVRFRWSEATPASFVLRIPALPIPLRFREPDASGSVPGLPALIRELSRALEYGRAAGVRASIEVTLPQWQESVVLRESTVAMEVSASFVEATRVKDALSSVGPEIVSEEHFPEPRDLLSWGGVFDVTRFDDSRFQ